MRNEKGQFIKGKRPEWLCKRISESCKGIKRSDEFKEKLRKVRTGWKFSDASKKKMSESHKGIKFPNRKGHPASQASIDALREYSTGREPWNKGKSGYKVGKRPGSMPSGENHNRWIKDRSKLKRTSSQGERRSTIYFDWRKQVWKRDNYKCKINNSGCSGKIEAHHILSWREYPELRYKINNGITLCHAHHPRKRAEEKRLIPEFQELVSVSKIII